MIRGYVQCICGTPIHAHYELFQHLECTRPPEPALRRVPTEARQLRGLDVMKSLAKQVGRMHYQQRR